jgi:hypothetical protein
MIQINKGVAFLGLISVFALSSCALTPPKSLMDIQAGEVFVLETPLTISPNHSRSFIQFGEVTGGSFNRREPHCRIEVRNLSEQSQTIQPKRFIITQVNIDEEMIALRNQPIQLAMNDSIAPTTMTDGVSAKMLALGGYERSETMDLVHLYLQSKQQPNVYRLTCSGSLSNGSPADAPRSYRPQRQQIEKILGEIGHIENASS